VVGSTVNDIMKKLALLTATALLSCAAFAKGPAPKAPTASTAATAASATPSSSAANFKLEAPFAVTPAVEEAALTSETWAEVYRVPPNQRKAAIDQLVKLNQTPTPLGIAIGGKLHVKSKGRPVQLDELRVELTRAGAPLAYDEQCQTVPTKGDRIEAMYTLDGDTSVTVVGEVLEHFAFGAANALATEPTRLAPVTPENCQNVQESRILYEGELTIRTKGSVTHREPVLLQSVLH